MSKAQKMAETLGISIQPSQMGYVPSPPPRGQTSLVPKVGGDPNVPHVLDMNGRSRKALGGIKKKFNKRYGKELSEGIEELSDAELARQIDAEIDRSSGGGRSTSASSPRLDALWNEQEVRRGRGSRPALTTGGGILGRTAPSAHDIYQAKQARDSRVNAWREQQRAREENARRREQSHSAFRANHGGILRGLDRDDKRAKENERRQREAEAARAGIPTWREKMRNRAETERQEQERKRIAAGRSSLFGRTGWDTERAGDDPSTGMQTPVLAGFGRQKEADKIARGLMSQTLFKNVRIKPRGSGYRADVTATTRSGDSSIEFYMQRQLKTLLFTSASAGSNRNEIKRALDTIYRGMPEDWVIAADPRIVVKAKTDKAGKDAVYGARMVRQFLNGLPPDRVADRQVFTRVRNDRARQEQESKDTIDTLGGYAGPERRDKGAADTGDRFRRTDPDRVVHTPDAVLDPETDDLHTADTQQMQQQAQHRGTGRAAELKYNEPEHELGGNLSSYDLDQHVAAHAYQGGGQDYEEDPFQQASAAGHLPGVEPLGGVTSSTPRTRRDLAKEQAAAALGLGTDPWDSSPGYTQPVIPKGTGYYDRPGQHPGSYPNPRPGREPFIPRSDVETKPHSRYDPRYGQPWPDDHSDRGRGREERHRDGGTADPDELINAAGRPTKQFNTSSPTVDLIVKRFRENVGQPDTISDNVKFEGKGHGGVVLIRNGLLEVYLVRSGRAPHYTMMMYFTQMDLNNYRAVFNAIPNIAFEGRLSNATEGSPMHMRNSLKHIIKFVEARKPELLREMLNMFGAWFKSNKYGNSIGSRASLESKVEKRNNPPEKKTRTKKVKTQLERDEARLAGGIEVPESLCSLWMKRLTPIEEQSWYKEHVHVATKIQNWIMRHLGGYQVSCGEIHDRFDMEHSEDAVDKAIEILRANAAMYPMTGTNTQGRDCIYMINMTRMSSAQL